MGNVEGFGFRRVKGKLLQVREDRTEVTWHLKHEIFITLSFPPHPSLHSESGHREQAKALEITLWHLNLVPPKRLVHREPSEFGGYLRNGIHEEDMLHFRIYHTFHRHLDYLHDQLIWEQIKWRRIHVNFEVNYVKIQLFSQDSTLPRERTLDVWWKL